MNEQLAALAHTLWVEQMREAGWRYGEMYNEALRTHDALLPFDQLPRRYRLEATNAIAAEDLPQTLLRAIDYSHGPARLFLLEEMTAGRKVILDPPTIRREVGSVESWATDAHGELELIRVRWEDGSITEHVSWELELARFEELE